MGGASRQPTEARSIFESLYAVTAGYSSRETSKMRSRRSWSSSVVLYPGEGWESCATHFWYSEAPSCARALGTLNTGRTCIEDIILMPSARDAWRAAYCLP